MNRKTTVAIASCAAALTAFLPAAAADIEGGLGAGDATCAEYLADAGPSPERNIYVQWASGQISGMISKSSQRYPQDLSVATLAQRLETFCKANPQESIFVGATTIGKQYADTP
jgi:hypothetical protein